MKLKFVKKVDKTKFYLFKNITNHISLTITQKPNAEISIWFDDRYGNNYDHLEFADLDELKSYVKSKFTKDNCLFLVNIEDSCTFAFIDRRCSIDTKKYKIQKVMLWS
jgi:hypothetical protein